MQRSIGAFFELTRNAFHAQKWNESMEFQMIFIQFIVYV